MSQTVIQNLAYLPIAWGDGYDSQGNPFTAKAVWTGPLNLAQSSSYLLDTQAIQNAETSTIARLQSLYFHNPTTSTITVTVLGTNFVLKLAAGTGGLLPLIAGDRPVLTFTSSGNTGVFEAWLLNVQALGYTYTLGS